jgi:hypothetical protein
MSRARLTDLSIVLRIAPQSRAIRTQLWKSCRPLTRNIAQPGKRTSLGRTETVHEAVSLTIIHLC